MLVAKGTPLFCCAKKKFIVIAIREFNKETQKYGVMVAIYYSHFPHAATDTELPTYITLQISKKNTPSKLYDNLYKTTNSVRTYLPVSEPFA
jgi:hypothetical protein